MYDISDNPLSALSVDEPQAYLLEDVIDLKQTNGNWTLSVHFLDFGPLIEQKKLKLGSLAKALKSYNNERYSVASATLRPFASIFSFDEGSVKPSIMVSLCFDQEMNILSKHVINAHVLNRKRYTYDDVNDILSSNRHPEHASWHMYYAFAKALYSRRLVQLIHQLHSENISQEQALRFAQDYADYYDRSNKASFVIAECMIIANAVLCEWVTHHKKPMIYRCRTVRNDNRERYQRSRQSWGYQEILSRPFYSLGPLPNIPLGKTCYGRFSAPVRRDDDLINHIMISAYIRGKSPPFCAGDLKKMVFRLNNLHRQCDKPPSQNGMNLNDRDIFAASVHLNLHCLLSHEIDLNPLLANRLVQSIQIGLINEEKIAQLLFFPSNTPLWHDIKLYCLVWLYRQRSGIKTVIRYAALLQQMPPLEAITIATDKTFDAEQNAHTYCTEASMNYQSRRYHVPSVSHASPCNSVQKALVLLLVERLDFAGDFLRYLRRLPSQAECKLIDISKNFQTRLEFEEYSEKFINSKGESSVRFEVIAKIVIGDVAFNAQANHQTLENAKKRACICLLEDIEGHLKWLH